MSSLFRSQKMKYCSLMCNEDSSWEILNVLGQHNSLHFIDHDANLPLINRSFFNYIKRCDEVQSDLNFIRENFQKFQLKETECVEYDELLAYFQRILENRAVKDGKKDGKTYFFEIEQDVHEQKLWLEEQLKNFENLTEKQNQIKEYKAVLKSSQSLIGNHFFRENQGMNNGEGNANIVGLSLDQVLDSRVSMNQIVGIIDAAESLRFQRMIFRVTKGNAYVQFSYVNWDNEPIIDPVTRKPLERQVFIIVYPGGTMDIIKNKLNRICDSFNCSRFGFPQNEELFLQKLKELDDQKKDNNALIEMTKHNLREFLKIWCDVRPEANCSKVVEYLLYTEKEKNIYHTLNMLETNQKIYKGNAWIPKENLDKINETLQDLARKNSDIGGFQIRTQKKPGEKISKPPTYFRTNDFTGVFQLITDTYGVPRYQEINPTVMNLMTFPFLFGVMFGDIGHGFVLFLAGLFLVLFNNTLKLTPIRDFLFVRYFVLFMGFFAFYCGLLYNDFLSISLDLWGSCYDASKTEPCWGDNTNTMCIPYKDGEATLNDCVYPFGIDPVWNISTQSITFMNTYKMKMSVILGVLQMSIGIIFKGLNAIHFKQTWDFIFEFIPQIVFLTVTFGYMDFMIIYKWLKFYQGSNSEFAPSIISTLINMPLKMGSPDGFPLYGNVDGSTQESLQVTFLVIALLMIPTMLVFKPVIVYYSNKGKHHSPPAGGVDTKPLLQNDTLDESENFGIQKQSKSLSTDNEIQNDLLNHQQIKAQAAGHDEEEHGFGEIFVHQIIETIEFVLGSISNTASYLRLWALSLAHSQLAEVFFENGIRGGVETGGFAGGIGLIIGYYVFALITFGVLMCMDVMECFLHALRLHWVEFQNKFYKADGIQFTPFSFVSAMQNYKASGSN